MVDCAGDEEGVPVTLAEVAKAIRGECSLHPQSTIDKWVLDAVDRFETDPEFKLPERIEVLLARANKEARDTTGMAQVVHRDYAHRLHELLTQNQSTTRETVGPAPTLKWRLRGTDHHDVGAQIEGPNGILLQVWREGAADARAAAEEALHLLNGG